MKPRLAWSSLGPMSLLAMRAARAADEAGASMPVPLGEPPSAVAIPHSLLPHGFSPWGMFVSADPVVKGVMCLLLLASVATWTIGVAKSIELRAASLRLARRLESLGKTRGLTEALHALGGSRGIERQLVDAAATEVGLSRGCRNAEGVKERVASRIERIEAAAGRKMMKGTGILATIGSTGPFVGLFGTVWGIMNSFIGISKAHTTNLAVVAPGIAEALMATAIGLVAAIPAVVIYNVFSRAITGYKAQVGDLSAEVIRLVSRDLDLDNLPMAAE